MASLHIHYPTDLQQLHFLTIRASILLCQLFGLVFRHAKLRCEVDEWTVAVIPLPAVQSCSDDLDGVTGIETELFELLGDWRGSAVVSQSA
jgi:hypothetical protein